MRELRLRHESWPIAGRFTISRGSKTTAEVIVAEIEQDGRLGRGECVPYGRYGESIESVMALLRGQSDAIARGLTREALQEALPPGAARNALDCALWDLEAKLTGRPVWELAGLARPGGVTTAYTLSLDSAEKMGAAAKAAAARPLLKLKLAGQGDFAQDIERVKAVRAGAPGARLIVDANEGWSGADYARLAPALAALGVALIEQPLPAGADEALAGRLHPVPVCADESCHDRATLKGLAGRYEAINVKLDKSGGLTEALALAREARRAGFEIMVGCMLGTSLAMAPALLVAQGAAFVDLDGPLLLARDRTPGLEFAGMAKAALIGCKGRQLILALLLPAALAGCAETSQDTPSHQAPAASTPVPASCPATLAFVKDRLKTPYPELESFIGKDALDATLNKPVDQMIAEGGGIDASIAGGERYVANYTDALKDPEAVREEYHKEGMTDEWIDTYMSSLADGITINQAFVDAVKCRKTRQTEQSKAAPSP